MAITEKTGSYIINGLSGIWNSYGCPVNQSEGLFISVENSDASAESLIDLVGFDTTKKQLGALRSEKIVSEVVVMLPMLQSDIEYSEIPPDEPAYIPPQDPCAPCEDKKIGCPDNTPAQYAYVYDPTNSNNLFGMASANAEPFLWGDTPVNSSVIRPQDSTGVYKKKQNRMQYCRTEDAWLFTIEESIINKILGVSDYKKQSISSIKSILNSKADLNNDNNIVKLMKAMIKYNFPPHLNWLLFPENVPPYAMYAVEFSIKFDKEDLSNIWQGTMPKPATIPEEEEIVIEHFLTDEEIFGGFDIANIENIKLSIFKCKMRAENNYYRMINRTQSYKSSLGAENAERNKWYQYNWPYDNFSIVELLKIDGGEVREFIKPEDSAKSVLITTTPDENGQTKQYTMDKKAYNDWIASNTNYTPDLYK